MRLLQFANDAAWPKLDWIILDNLPKKPAPPLTAEAQNVSRDDVAFLQFTSGSTSEPKGVMISHENLAHNLATFLHEGGANESIIVVSWCVHFCGWMHLLTFA